MGIGKWHARFFFAAATAATFGTVILVWFAMDVRTFAIVKSSYHPSDVWIVDRYDIPMESIRTGKKYRSLDWLQWSDVSPSFKVLLVKSEDRRFFSHPGVDFLALSKASWDWLSGSSRRGASTITMQLAEMLRGQNRNGRRGMWQKIRQILWALKIESRWTKDEILEAYVNLVPFRGELIGLRTASLGYLGKNPSGLLKEESALLVALLRAPNATPDLIAKRACRMLQTSDCGSIDVLSQTTFAQAYKLERPRELIPILAKQFVESENGSLIKTSLDQRVQQLALSTLREQLRVLRKQNVNDGAVLVLESQTGRVVAYVANAGAGSASAEQIDGIQTRRQAGSTIKPFVYATAMDWRLLTPKSLLEDSPADISVSGAKVYHPKNYDQVFRGLISVSDALGSSINVAAVRALQLVGESRVLDRMHALGFERLQEDEYYGPSLALGSIDVTLWELSQAYRQFAVEGSVFTGPTRAAIFNILASSEHRRFTFGMDSLLSLPFPAAVKTGTSKDMRDNWCLGWTPHYTVGVWVGNFSGQPMWNVSGMSGAAPIWRSLMLALHPHPQTFPTQFESESVPLRHHLLSRIRYPAPNMLVGLDPDIPEKLQQLPIEIENPRQGHQLFLNHRLLNRSQETTFLPLKRGKYVVELKAETGQLVDAVKFEVR